MKVDEKQHFFQAQRDAPQNSPQPAIREHVVRREHEAMEIMLMAKEVLAKEALMNFFETIVKSELDPVMAYKELHAIAIGHENLQEMILDILSPQQALSLGRHVYSQHCQRMDLKRILLKVKQTAWCGESTIY